MNRPPELQALAMHCIVRGQIFHRNTSQSGFTLLELSLVLVVLGILANMFIQPVSSQVEIAKRQRTDRSLDRVEQALIGFAIAHGRLPCPADWQGPAIEKDECGTGNNYGLLPAITLGLPGARNQQGALLDGWNQPIHYAVSAADHPSRGLVGWSDYTTSDEINAVGMSELASELEICAIAVAAACPPDQLLANQVPVIFFSKGKPLDDSTIEQENTDGDDVFISHPYSQSTANRFDDRVRWIPENILLFRLLQAGVVP